MRNRVREWVVDLAVGIATAYGASEYRRLVEDPETITLCKISWDEVETETYTDITEELTWSGGASKEITYTREVSAPGYGDYHRLAQREAEPEEVLIVEEHPAARETIHAREWERDVTTRKTGWIEEGAIVPEAAEETGETKEVTYHE